MDSIATAPTGGQISTHGPQAANAIEFLEGQTVRLMLRDSTVLQGKLERVGWMNTVSEAISYLCLKLDADSVYVLTAHGMSSRSGLVYLPWDWISCLVAP